MKSINMLVVLFLGSALGIGILALSAPLSAKPGWQHPAQGELALSAEQRDQIANLRAAFRDRLKNLDWAVTDGEHAPGTLQQARELRLALREEIRDLLTEAQLNHLHSSARACPHGGQTVKRQSATLYL
ncbi:MAG: hypothetical protein V2J20_10830 [Wenzhouxiangella sp.]|jgi:hypothetical protein|nr:hypothetical protein [Wenzhouxiangella sp.]